MLYGHAWPCLGSIPGARHLSRYVTSHPVPGQLSLAIPLWVGTVSTSQRPVMPCDWGAKAGMVCVWVAGKTVWSHCYTWAISEPFRDKGLIIKCYINSSVYFTFFTLYVYTYTVYTKSLEETSSSSRVGMSSWQGCTSCVRIIANWMCNRMVTMVTVFATRKYGMTQ